MATTYIFDNHLLQVPSEELLNNEVEDRLSEIRDYTPTMFDKVDEEDEK